MPHLFGSKSNSKYGGDRPRWRISTVLKGFDSFGKEVPAFNIKGDSRVTTALGGTVTCSILTVSLLYSILKIIQMA